MCERSSGSSLHLTKSGIKSAAITVLSPVGTSLQLSKGLGAEAGFQASQVWSLCGDFSKQDSSRVPLDPVVSFTVRHKATLQAGESTRACQLAGGGAVSDLCLALCPGRAPTHSVPEAS
eukprot:5076710-Amphidinium_carterae.1